jgi:hypothetical protein
VHMYMQRKENGGAPMASITGPAQFCDAGTPSTLADIVEPAI